MMMDLARVDYSEKKTTKKDIEEVKNLNKELEDENKASLAAYKKRKAAELE